jgi:hypothetical protein
MEDDSSTKEELHLLYEVTVSDLSYFKMQQWSVTNYSFALLAGLIGVAQFLKPDLRCADRSFLVILAVAASVVAVVVLAKLQTSITVRQARLEHVRGKFSASFQQSWAAETKGQEYIHSIYFLYAAVVVAGVLAIWLIGFRL